MSQQPRGLSQTIRGFALIILALALTCGVDARIRQRPGIVGRALPFPGKLRCVLRADLDPDNVLSSSLGGDPTSDGDLWMRVYWFQGQINVHLHFNGHDLSGELPPLNQTINLGHRGGVGKVLWDIAGMWTVENTEQIELDRWIMNAQSSMIPGTRSTVYNLIKRIDRNPAAYYGTVQTTDYPDGAMRGQFIRGWPNMAYPNPRC